MNTVIVPKVKCLSRYTCSIPDYESDTVILTGGSLDQYQITLSLVERYGPNGFVERLPYLNHPREGHGCGYYHNKDGEKV